MNLKQLCKTVLAGSMAFCCMNGPVKIEAFNSVSFSDSGGKLVLSNDYIAREYTIDENSHVLTSLLLNKRINTSLIPQEGSEDFVIKTVSESENENNNEIKYTYSPEPLATTGWNATLKNSENTEFDATEVAKLFDDKLDTHIDQYQITGNPFTLDIDFKEEKTIAAMSVNKRPGYTDSNYGINGTMGGYEIWISSDGSNYNKIKEGTFTEQDYHLHQEGNLYNVGDMVYVNFDSVVQTQYVRVVQTSAALGSAEEFSSSEIDFYETPVKKSIVVDAPEQVLNRENWKISIKNGAGNAFSDEHANYVIDGNLDSYPNELSISGHPFTVDIDLGSEQTVSSISIDKRPGFTDPNYGTNGTMGEFDLYVSNDGVDYQLAGAGNFTQEAYNLHQVGDLHNVGDRVYANFSKSYTTRYVRLVQKSVSMGNAQEFTTAELNLYSDSYSGPNWNTPISASSEIKSSSLEYSDHSIHETEKGGKKLTINYKPIVLNDVTYSIAQIAVLEADEHYMRTFLEISVSDKDKAQIDYIDTDRFVLPSDVTGIWSHPDESSVSSMWIGKHEIMLGQPIYVNGLFMGSEFPAADTLITDNTTQIRYYSGKTFTQLENDHQLTTDGKFVTWQNVVGAAQGTETAVVQSDFFDYIEDIATPTEFRKQYNSWYDNMMNITDESIASSFYGAEAGLSSNGVEPLDSYVVDDGWNNYYDGTYTSNPGSAQGTTPNQTGFWEFNAKFPNELYTSSALTDKFQSAFGLWLGPQGGYNYFSSFARFLEASGTGYAQNDYWTNVCVGSDRYVKNLQSLFIDYQSRFNIDYWKWDGFAVRPCTNPDHDHMTGGYKNMYYTTDLWEKWTDLFDAVRAKRAEKGKGLFINATCYVNLSPWLLQWVNTIWVQDSGDTGELGTGERHQQKIYYRDQVYYQLYKQNQIQFPLKNIYNHDPIYGVSDNSNATTDVFREYLFANAVRGTAFWELYYSPSIMDDAKWKVSADVLAWAEENHEILKNAKLFGEQPRNGVYGYSCWNGNNGIISFTNPLDTEQTYSITLNELVGVNSSVQDLKGIQVHPYTTESINGVSYNDTLNVHLEPHQTLIYQYGKTDSKAPVLVNVQSTNSNELTLKFDERIQLGEFTIDGKAVNAELKEDYRTVVLTSESVLNNDVILGIENIQDFSGNTYKQDMTVSCYENGVIAEVESNADVENGENINFGYDAFADVNWLDIANKKYTLSTGNKLKEKADFSMNVVVNTESNNVDLISSNDEVRLSIDENGYVVFDVKGLRVSSEETVTTVIEKAHGKFGTEDYVATTTQQTVIGKVNDGKAHSISAVREANGMLKLYIDGKLSNSVYDVSHINDELVGGKFTIADQGFIGKLGNIQVLNYGLAYNEVKTVNSEMVGIRPSHDTWTVTACSEMDGMTGDASAMAAIDGNTHSWWHTNYSGQDNHSGQHWIAVDFGKEESFDKFYYTGRGASSNGSIKDYILEIKDADGNYSEIKRGTFTGTSSEEAIELGKVYTGYGFRLTSVSTQNGQDFAAAVELDISKSDSWLSQEELANKKATVDFAENLEDYSQVTVNAYQKIANKIKATEKATEYSWNILVEKLESAKTSLVNVKELKEVIQIAQEKDESLYTSDTFEKLKEAVMNAELLVNTAESQSEVDAMIVTLNDAIAGLKEKDPTTPDKGEIQVGEKDPANISAILDSIDDKLQAIIDEKLNEGKDVQINIIVDELTEANMSEGQKADRTRIEEFVKKNQRNVGGYFDISIQVECEGSLLGTITETVKPLQMQLTIPEGLKKEGRTFTVVRVHNGSVEELTTTQQEDVLSFETDKFSVYAITYKDGAPSDPTQPGGADTGDHSMIPVFIGLLSSSFIAILLMIKKSKKIVD